MSTPESTIIGFLPPSSSVKRVKCWSAASPIFRPVATPFATRLKIRLVIQIDTHSNELGMFVQVIVVHRKLNFPPHPDRPRH